MTRARRQRKWWRGTGLLVILAGLATTTPAALRAAADPVVVNPNTGLAISGFDPVGYFTDHRPEIGRADLELRVDGYVWRFVNSGNRAAFKDHPEVYAPRFGGYDPVALARGASVPGHPMFWSVTGERLYLFYSEQARSQFLAAPGRIIAAAARKWPAIAATIGR